MTGNRRTLDIGFPVEREIAEWERRHDAGEVPGRWPYGLDALSRLADLTPVSLPYPSRSQRIRARTLARPRTVRDAVGLTWDENAAWRMATVAPHAQHVSGVIWLTDVAARGGDVRGSVRALSRCDALWVLSEAQVEPLSALVIGTPVHYVRFAIDDEFFPRRSLPETLRVVSAGGDRDRDTATLFGALEIVHAEMPHVDLVVQTTSTLRPPKGVKVVAQLPHTQLRDLYASATIVLIATRSNLHVSGMTVSLEAMATGRPVVVTRTPGIEDYIEDGRTGLLSSIGDAASLARGALELLQDPERVAAMGSAARGSVEERFSPAHMAAQIGAVVSGSSPA